MKWFSLSSTSVQVILLLMILVVVLGQHRSDRRTVDLDEDFWITQIQGYKAISLYDSLANELCAQAPIVKTTWDGVRWKLSVSLTNAEWDRLRTVRSKKAILSYRLWNQAELQ